MRPPGFSQRVAFVWSTCVLVALPAAAQVPSPTPVDPEAASVASPAANRPRWEIELLGGLAAGTDPTRGSGQLPPSAGTMIPFPGWFPAPSISSWYYGEGAALFNEVMVWLGRSAAIVPLDEILVRTAVTRPTGAQFGARIGRVVGSRLTAEVALTVDTGRLTMSDRARTILESSARTSLEAFRWLGSAELARLDQTVKSGGLRLMTTGALTIALGSGQPLTPFVTVGAGVRSSLGAAEVSLAGSYHRTAFDLQFEESDTVHIQFESKATPVFVVGAGFRTALSPASGIRGEVRLLAGPNGIRTRLRTTPTRAEFARDGTLILTTTPLLAFATPGSAGESTLSGPVIEEFETFSGGGTSTSLTLTIGYFRRF
jgi:hypothetical protein